MEPTPSTWANERARFGGTTGSMQIGPGEYEPAGWGQSIEVDQHRKLALSSSLQLSARPGPGALGFGSSYMQRETMLPNTPVAVAPGTYEPNAWGQSLAQDQLKRGRLSSKLGWTAKPGLGQSQLGFGASYPQRRLPSDAAEHDGPGPGAYNLLRPTDAFEKQKLLFTSRRIANGARSEVSVRQRFEPAHASHLLPLPPTSVAFLILFPARLSGVCDPLPTASAMVGGNAS